MTKSAVKFDDAQVSEFLEKVLSRDYYHLISISTKKGGAPKGYAAESVDDAKDWLRRQDDLSQNLYYQWNAPSRHQSKKANRDELKFLYGAHVDIDLPKNVKRNTDRAEELIDNAIADLEASQDDFGGRPHIVFTGNGVQGLWTFAEPLPAAPANLDAVERVNKALALRFGGDMRTFNADRILRIPGTRNIPDDLKKSRGCRTILAELIRASRDDFVVSDFAKLPDPETRVAVRSGRKLIDYTRKPYVHLKQPYTFDEMLRWNPLCREEALEVFRKTNSDRSTAAWPLIKEAVKFICEQERCGAIDLLDDNDYKRNIMELCLNADLDEIFSRYEDVGLGRLGADVGVALDILADEKYKWTARAEARKETRNYVAQINAKPLPDVKPHEARVAFIEHVKTSFGDINQLPNVLANGDKTAIRQLVTESNVRDILRVAEITARFDVMRDQVRFSVHPDAGAGSREPARPFENWEIALKAAHRDIRHIAEEGLILDALAAIGLHARGEIPKILAVIAKEKRYHPIEDYCKQIAWDGVPRIAQVAACLNTSHPLAERYMEIFFFQCVAVILSLRKYLLKDVGEQLSSVVVLDGMQGLFKTTFWERVAPPGMMAKGQTLKIGSHGENDAKRECLSGVVCNMDEIMASFDRSHSEAFKNFLSLTFDEFRTAYAHHPISKPRMTVFCGTGNNTLLYDQTGSRRFLVLQVHSIDLRALGEIDLQQVYAEAYHRVIVEREPWWLDKEEDKIRAHHNEAHRVITEEEQALESYLANLPRDAQDEWMTANEICKLLNLKYVPAKWPVMKAILLRDNRAFKDRVRQKNGNADLRKVYDFPVTPEALQAVRAGYR